VSRYISANSAEFKVPQGEQGPVHSEYNTSLNNSGYLEEPCISFIFEAQGERKREKGGRRQEAGGRKKETGKRRQKKAKGSVETTNLGISTMLEFYFTDIDCADPDAMSPSPCRDKACLVYRTRLWETTAVQIFHQW